MKYLLIDYMKYLLLILGIVFSPSLLFAQADEWTEYSALPQPVRHQVDSLTFKNALHLAEGGYLVETGEKHKSTDTLYSEAGDIIDVSHYRSGGSRAGWIILTGICALFICMLL
jgi:hypothetical protein